MITTVRFMDRDGNCLATGNVEDQGGYYAGAVDVRCMPEEILRQFEEYETLVNGQVFSLLDQAEDQIAATPVVALFGDGRRVCVRDLQIFPSARTVSFRVAQSPTGHALR